MNDDGSLDRHGDDYAGVYRKAKQLRESGRLRDALREYEQLLPHLKCEARRAAVLAQCASLHSSLGQVRDAEEAISMAVGIAEGLTPSDRRATHLATAWHNIGSYYESIDQVLLAINYYQVSYGILRQQDDLVDPDIGLRTARCASKLAGVLGMNGEYEAALEYADEAVAINARLLGADHIGLAKARVARANVLCDWGRYEEAEREFRVALPIYLARHGRDSVSVARLRQNFAFMLEQFGRHRESAEQLEEAIDIEMRLGTVRGADLAELMVELSEVLWKSSLLSRSRAWRARAIAVLELAGQDSAAYADLRKRIEALDRGTDWAGE